MIRLTCFLDQGLQKVIDEQGFIETDIEDVERNIEPVKVKLGKIRVGNPVVREADGSVEPLFPTEARLRNITYAAEIFLEMSIVRGEVEEEAIEVNIGQMPIMIGCAKCNLAKLSPEDWIKNGEDPMDPGGYFIINGTERVLMTLEDLAPNKIMVEFDDRYGDQIEVAKVFSQRRGYRALVIVERGRKSILEVSFPSISGRLNLVMLMRALGLETDQDIVNAVSDDPEIQKFMLENLDEAEADTVDSAMEKIGKRVAAGQARDYQMKRAHYVIDRYLLPHLNPENFERIEENDPKLAESRINKAYFLAGWQKPVVTWSHDAGHRTTRTTTPTSGSSSPAT